MGFKINNRLTRLRISAKKRNIKVDLNLHYYKELLKLGCAYCGTDLMKEKGYSLDRIDNNRGYVYENVTPCCGTCNKAKGKLESYDFFEWVKRAYFHQKKVMEQLNSIELKEKEAKKMDNVFKNSKKFKNSDNILIDGDRK